MDSGRGPDGGGTLPAAIFVCRAAAVSDLAWPHRTSARLFQGIYRRPRRKGGIAGRRAQYCISRTQCPARPCRTSVAGTLLQHQRGCASGCDRKRSRTGTLRGRRNSQPEVDVPLVRGGAVRGPCARGASGGLVGVRYGEGGGSQGALRENLAPPSQRCEGVHHTGRRHAALLNFMRLMGRQARRLRLSEDQQRWISVWISGYRAARRGRSFSDFMAAGSTRERDHTIIPGPHKGIAQICYSPMLEGFISGWPCSRERVIPDSPSSPVEGESC